MKYLLGIDIGTSGTKTVLFDLAGGVVASSTVEYPLYQPKNGWAEQRPEDWWNAVVQSCAEVMQGRPADSVAGIGLSGQMHGLVMLDKNDRVIRPSIIWCDQRTGAECDEITEKMGKERLIEITANPALTGFTASKILWVKNYEPENFERCAKMMLPKDYVRYQMTGEFATEVSDASGMQLMNVRKRDYSDEMLQLLGITREQLPKMYESYEISGRVSASVAEKMGVAAGTPVVGGGGDQAAGAIGNGIIREGIVSCSLGSSGVVFASTENPLIDPQGRVHTFCHAVPNTWHVMGVTQGAGLSLKWLRDNFFADVCKTAELLGKDPYVLMDQMAAELPIGAEGLIYLPYLMGERTPHLDPDCRGVFFGLSAMHTRNNMIRAVMEGVSFSQTDCLEIIRGMGVQVEAVRASGGGAKSGLWRQMLADCFNAEVRRLTASEGPALGVAILAGVGSGVYRDVAEGCEAAVHDRDKLLPIAENVARYRSRYALYQQLYTSLRQDFKTLASMQ